MADVTEKKDTSKSTEKKANGGFFKGIKTEFNKVVWPDKTTLVKESGAVIIISVIVGAVIALVDAAIKLGLEKII